MAAVRPVGVVTVRVASSARWKAQPGAWCLPRWSVTQNPARLVIDVGPSGYRTRWSSSPAATSRRQPGNRQRLSRARTNRASAAPGRYPSDGPGAQPRPTGEVVTAGRRVAAAGAPPALPGAAQPGQVGQRHQGAAERVDQRDPRPVGEPATRRPGQQPGQRLPIRPRCRGQRLHRVTGGLHPTRRAGPPAGLVGSVGPRGGAHHPLGVRQRLLRPVPGPGRVVHRAIGRRPPPSTRGRTAARGRLRWSGSPR